MSNSLKFLDFSCSAEARPAGAGSKKGTFFDTFFLSVAITRQTRNCHSELGSGFFEPTLVSAASSVTELRIGTRVGRKGPERSSERHLRVKKWRKKANFLAKSSGKNGVSLRMYGRRTDAAKQLRSSRLREADRAWEVTTPRTPIYYSCIYYLFIIHLIFI